MTTYDFASLYEGQKGEFAKTVTETDIVLFAGISGDTNPIHLNIEYAEKTRFKGRIAHGMITAGFISATLANVLPGEGSIYLSQTLNFKRPVRPGDTVQTKVEIIHIDKEKRIVTLDCNCYNQNKKIVLTGQAKVMLPK